MREKLPGSFDSFPFLNALALRAGLEKELRLYYVCSLYTKGKGHSGRLSWSDREVIADVLKAPRSKHTSRLKPISDRTIKRLFRSGEGIFWDRDWNSGREISGVRLYSIERIAANLEPYRQKYSMPNNLLFELVNDKWASPIKDLRTLKKFRAHILKNFAFSFKRQRLSPENYARLLRDWKSVDKGVYSALSYALEAKVKGSERVEHALQRRNERLRSKRKQKLYNRNKVEKQLPGEALSSQLGISRKTVYNYQDILPEIEQYKRADQVVIDEFIDYQTAHDYAKSANQVFSTTRFYVVSTLSGFSVIENQVTKYSTPLNMFLRKDLNIAGLASTRLERYNRSLRSLQAKTVSNDEIVISPGREITSQNFGPPPA